MIDEQILVPSGWRTALGLARVLLAAGCLTTEILYAEPHSTLGRILLVAFLLYAVVVLLWKGVSRFHFELVTLVLDTLFTLIFATVNAPPAVWLCAALVLLVMAEGLLFHPWKHVLTAATPLIVLLMLIRSDDIAVLLPVSVGAALLALLAARQRQILSAKLVTTTGQVEWWRAESEKAREEERERIAADFHDGPLQSFISLQMRLEIVRRLLERDGESAKTELLGLQDVTKNQVADIRAFVRGMRPVDVEGGGLSAALSRLVDAFQKDTDISTTFLGAGHYDSEDAGVIRELVKIVREALHNTQKHAGASRVAVGIERSNAELEILIQDDGSGFAFAGTYTLEELDLLGLGPESIKQRVRALAGDLVLESRPGVGAGLKIRIPL